HWPAPCGPEGAAELVARGIVDLLGVQGSIVFRYEPEDGTLHSIAAHGPASHLARNIVLNPREGIAGLAVAERKFVAPADVAREPRIEHAPERRAILMQNDIRAMLGIPLPTHERIIGALAVGDRAGREFTEEELLGA